MWIKTSQKFVFHQQEWWFFTWFKQPKWWCLTKMMFYMTSENIRIQPARIGIYMWRKVKVVCNIRTPNKGNLVYLPNNNWGLYGIMVDVFTVVFLTNQCITVSTKSLFLGHLPRILRIHGQLGIHENSPEKNPAFTVNVHEIRDEKWSNLSRVQRVSMSFAYESTKHDWTIYWPSKK